MAKSKPPAAAPKLRKVKSFAEAEAYLFELMPRTPYLGFCELHLEHEISLEHTSRKRGRSVSYRAYIYSPKHREVKATEINELVRMVVAVLFPLLKEQRPPKPPETEPQSVPAIEGKPLPRITYEPALPQ